MFMQNDTDDIVKRKKKRNIIILSDFVESAWESVRFSFDKLINNNHELTFIQTYRKPGFGQMLLKNIIPVLKQIVNNDLLDLKFKTLQKYKIEDTRISIHPLEGDWDSLFYYKRYVTNADFMVFSMKEAFPGSDSNLLGKVYKLATIATMPLFILPYPLKDGAFKKALFMIDKKLNGFPKTDVKNSALSVVKNASIDFRGVAKAKTGENEFSNVTRKLSDAYGLHSETTEVMEIEEEPVYLSEASEYDIIVIDQALVNSRFNTSLDIRKWVESKNGVPILICQL